MYLRIFHTVISVLRNGRSDRKSPISASFRSDFFRVFGFSPVPSIAACRTHVRYQKHPLRLRKGTKSLLSSYWAALAPNFDSEAQNQRQVCRTFSRFPLTGRTPWLLLKHATKTHHVCCRALLACASTHNESQSQNSCGACTLREKPTAHRPIMKVRL
mgnify:CR=1 FL=1